MAELDRVADSMYITYPWWWRLTTLLTPGHAWIVTKRNDGSLKFTPWRKACNVPGYFGTGGDGEVRGASLGFVTRPKAAFLWRKR